MLAYLRDLRREDDTHETVLCVANLSRFAQPVALDLKEYMGALPVEMLGATQPHGRHVVVVGKKLIVEPEPAEDEWLKQWRELAGEIGEVWPEGVSAVEVVSEMRR